MVRWELDFSESYTVKTGSGEDVALLLLVFSIETESDRMDCRILEIYSQSQLVDVMNDREKYDIPDESREGLLHLGLPMENADYPMKIVDGPAATIYADGVEELSELNEQDSEDEDEEELLRPAGVHKVVASS